MANNKAAKGRPLGYQPKDDARGVKPLGQDMLDQMPDDYEDDEDYNTASTLVPVINAWHGLVKFEMAGRRYRLKPGEIAMVEGAYGTPRVFRKGGDPIPSVVELDTGRKVLPVSDPRIDKDQTGEPVLHRRFLEAREQELASKRASAPA